MSTPNHHPAKQAPTFGLKLATVAGLFLAVAAAPSWATRPGPIVTGAHYGEGTWVNVAPAEACGGPMSDRVCAEFVDKNVGSPYTGKICCVDSTLISQGRFSDCSLLLRGPRAENEEEEEGGGE